MSGTGELIDALAVDPGAEATVLKTVQKLGAVIGPSALITALLYYFGWAKTEAFCQFYGLDASILGFSTQDYLLQSIRSVFIPLGDVLIAGLLVLWAHSVVSRRLQLRPDRTVWTWVAPFLAALGIVSFATGLATYRDTSPSDAILILTPLSLLLGVALVSYALLFDRRRRHARWSARLANPSAKQAPSIPPGPPALCVILVSLLIGIGLVYLVANYADIKGRQEANFVYSHLQEEPGVVVYSTKGLDITAPGVHQTTVEEPESEYGFRYDGLILLFHSNGKYFLISSIWSQSGGTMIVLHDTDSLRLEFVR